MIGIVGCGVSGTLVILELIRLNIPPNDLLIVDPFFDGGALGRQWGSIMSNTTWHQIVTSMNQYPSAHSTLELLGEKYKSDQTVLLSDLSYLLRKSLSPYLQELNIYVDKVSLIQKQKSGWHLVLGKGNHLEVEKVICCQGGKCKSLDFGIPTIPLEIALDEQALKRTVRPSEKVVLFGTAHSGTLILKNLLSIGAKTVAVYKGKQPFSFARDGHYDGIKQESAEIADKILETKPKSIIFQNYDDTELLLKHLRRSDWVINAVGFEPVVIDIRDEENHSLSFEKYSPDTGALLDGIYGFGLAYPGVTRIEEKVFKDVSIPSFIQQIQRCLPAIKNQE